MEILLDFQTQIPENKKALKRKRLYSKLEQINNKKSLIFISAPAGFGKSTLIADWINQNKYKAAWFSIDNNLTSPALFFKAFIRALSRKSSINFSNTENILKMPLNLSAKSTAFTILKEMEALEEDILLVLDNFHLLEDQLIYDFVTLLIKFMPARLNLIILSRKELPFSISREQTKDEMIILDQNQLKFSYLEMVNLLNREISLDLSEENLKNIYQITEGWPYAVELIIYKLTTEGEGVINKLSKKDQSEFFYFNDHLFSQVFSDLRKEEKELLVKTSVVENFTAELADYLRESDDSLVILNKLLKNNIFIELSNSKNSYFRYYNLFREFLIKQLNSEDKTKCFSKAAEWFAENNYYKEAVSAALKIDNHQLAVSYLEKSVPLYFKNAELKELINLFDLIEEKHLKESPILLIVKALSLFVLGNKKESLYYINLIENIDQLSSENRGRLLTLSTFMQNYQDAEAHCSAAAEALELISDADYLFKCNALMTLGQIQASYSRVEQSIKSFKKAAFLARENGMLFMEINSLMNLILKLAQSGNLEEALNLNLDNIDRLSSKQKLSSPVIDLLLIPLGIIYYFKGKYQQAKKNLIKGIEAAELLNLVHVYWMPMIYYGLSAFYLGEKNLAAEIIDDTLEFCNKNNKKINFIWADLERLNLKLKDQKDKVDILTQQKIISYSETVENSTFLVIKTKTVFLLSKLYLKLKSYNQALSSLNKLDQFKDKMDYYDFLKLKLLKSIVFYHLNDKEKSKDLLIKVILMLEKEKYLTVLNEEAEYLKILLKEFNDLESDILNNINFESDQKAAKEQQLIDPLTEREIEIIKLLAEGLSNKKIAEKLFITEGTTKWHLSNIYSKLAVRNRTKAAAKARKLNII